MGRFQPGHSKSGPGNPFARQIAQYRAELYDAVTREDIRDIALRLVALARGGEQWAVKELLDRTMGKPTQPIEGQFDHGVTIQVITGVPHEPLDAEVVDSGNGHGRLIGVSEEPE